MISGILTLGELIRELKRRDPSAIAEPGWRSAIGMSFPGYKGGMYTMDLDTEVFFAHYGECGQPLTLLGLNGMFGDKI